MRIVLISILFGMLVGSGYALVMIWRIEGAYAELWGEDVSTRIWSRKRYAVVLMLLAQLIGALSIIASARSRWISFAYFALLFLCIIGYCDAYRIMNNDLAKLISLRKKK